MLDKRQKKIMRIILIVLMVLIAGLAIPYLIFYLTDTKYPYFFEHFGFAIILFLIGLVALTITYSAQSRFQGDGKDSFMIVVSMLLFLSAVLAIIMSYVMPSMG